MINSKKIGLALGPIAFVLILLLVSPSELSPAAIAVLACTAWIAIWWITDCIPLAVTSLLPIVLFPLTEGLALAETTAPYGHKYVFLYIGGFIVAIAIERWNLHRRISLIIISIIGTHLKGVILGFMVATAFMSMWISNTATSVMMLPIGMAIVSQYRDHPDTPEDENATFGKALMLAIAYSASIGGMATLIGTPPNLVLAAMLQEIYGIEIEFAQWFLFGLPLSMILLLICWWYITSVAFTFPQDSFPDGRQEIKRQVKALGPMSYEEKAVLTVFCLTAAAWIGRPVLNHVLPALDDTIIAVVAAVSLFLIPASASLKRAILTWEEAVRLPWGILLLFGGGLALAAGFKSSGLADFLGGQLSLLDGVAPLLVLIVIVASVNFLTELTSNLATTAMILPILAPLALAIDVHPYILMIGAAVAASCAFMLPVATPPNAVVFGSGYLKIPDMVRVGIIMNLISIVCLSIVVYYVLPLLWDFEVSTFPASFRR